MASSTYSRISVAGVGMRILVVEDDRQAAAYLVKGLKESGYTVDHAPDGAEGLFLASTERYNALIVDRMLPGVPTIPRWIRS